jgi:hypothetical protein
MAFLAGKGFVILNRKAEQGDQKAKDLLSKLNSIDQDEADKLFAEILGKGSGSGSKKEKKTKAPGASATDGQGEITEGAGEQAPTGKTAPKAKGEAPVAAPAEPTGEVKPKGKQKPLTPAQDKLLNSSAFESFVLSEQPLTDEDAQAFAEVADTTPEEVKDAYNRYKSDIPQLKKGRVFDDAFDPAGKETKEEKLEQYKKAKHPDLGSDAKNLTNFELIQGMNKATANGDEEEYSKLFAQQNKLLQGKTAKAPAQQIDQPKGDRLAPENLKLTFDKYEGNVDRVLDDLRKQQIDISNNDLQDIVEGFAAGYKYNPGEATDKIKQGVAKNIQSNIQSDIEPNFQEIADEYGITAQEVQDVYNNEIKAGKQGTQIDTAGANVQPAGATGDIEPETQQLAGISAEQDAQQQPAEAFGNLTDKIKTQNVLAVNENTIEGTLQNGSQFVLEDTGKGYRYQIVNGPDGDEEPLEVNYGESNELIDFINNDGMGTLSPDEIDRQEFDAIESATEKVNQIKQQGRISNEEAEQVAREFQIPVADVLDIIGDQDFDEQGNPIGNINDKEVADELGVDEDQLFNLYSEFKGAPWEEENIKNILQQTGGDKAKALELLKQQQTKYAGKGPILKDQFLPGLIDQIAAEETNPSLPASEPTAEQLAETDSLFENTPEKEMVAAEQLAAQPADTDEFENDDERIGGQGFLTLSEKINFDRSVITNDQIQQVAQELGLEGKTPEQLTQIRNGVVKQSEKTPDRKSRTAMSAITAAIDSYINKPDQSQEQIKQTAQANAQQAALAAPATAAAQPQQQQATAAKPDRQKLEQAAADLGVDANLLEGLLELLKKVR